MAEAFGIVTGVLGLFQQSVECFEYIQLGRHFGQDFERSRLKIDLAVSRLVRWGEAISIKNNPRVIHDTKGEKVARKVESILDEIFTLMQSIQKASKRYELDAEPGDLELLKTEDLEPVAGRVHNRLANTIRQRQKRTSFVRKAGWALYDSKYFEKLISEFKEFMDELENLFPAEEVKRRELAKVEVGGLSDQASVSVLRDAAEDIDPLVFEAASNKIHEIGVKNFAREIKTDMNANVRLGNDMSEQFLRSGISISDRTVNEAGSISSTGSSGVHIGNRYGW